jgi:hypothetical protein
MKSFYFSDTRATTTSGLLRSFQEKYCGGGGTRTHKFLRTPVFKTGGITNYPTPPYTHTLVPYFPRHASIKSMEDVIRTPNISSHVSTLERQNGGSLRWEGHEYSYSEKSVDWYWAVGIVALSGAVASILLGNFLFGILILLGAFTLSLFAARKPNAVTFEITRRGILIDKKLFPYNTLDSFWIHEDTHHTTLLVRSRKAIMPLIMIPLSGSVNAESVHLSLSRFLEEEEHDMPISHRLVEYFGF